MCLGMFVGLGLSLIRAFVDRGRVVAAGSCVILLLAILRYFDTNVIHSVFPRKALLA